MDEQTTLLETETTFDSNSFNEEAAWKIIQSWLPDLLYQENMNDSQVRFEPGENYSSIFVLSSLLLRIRIRQKKHYFSIPSDCYSRCKDHLPADIASKCDVKSDFVRIPTESPEDVRLLHDFVLTCILYQLNGIKRQFDCCSRYVECSDAMRCVNPNQSLAVGCYYKKNIRAGIVFYGKNALK